MTQRIRDDVQRHAQGVGAFQTCALAHDTLPQFRWHHVAVTKPFLGWLLDGFAHG